MSVDTWINVPPCLLYQTKFWFLGKRPAKLFTIADEHDVLTSSLYLQLKYIKIGI